MRHPFQALACIKPGAQQLVLAACGSQLFVSSTSKPGILSRWPAKVVEDEPVVTNEAPQSKKRKLDDRAQSGRPDIIKLITAADNQHVVIVTGSDKCIRVLQVAEDGVLSELSQRCMPKRPCAIQITSDSQTIICGDKFGDVYSLPLIPSVEFVPAASNGTSKPKTFVPSASESTVHTKRNRDALKDQLRTMNGTEYKTKEPLAFEHQILLGHVSMLTDLQLASAVIDGTRRSFIITCDRDEHIRVSRGIPQAHITESFCLGHDEFLHKIRAVPDKDILISGGGDDWLGVWNWRTGKLMAKRKLPEALTGGNKTTVSSIWLLNSRVSNASVSRIIIKLEGILNLAVVNVDDLLDEKPLEGVIECGKLGGEVIDLQENDLEHWVASIDGSQRIQLVRLQQDSGSNWEMVTAESTDVDVLQELNEVEITRPDDAALDILLRGAEKLRKQGGEDEAVD